MSPPDPQEHAPSTPEAPIEVSDDVSSAESVRPVKRSRVVIPFPDLDQVSP